MENKLNQCMVCPRITKPEAMAIKALYAGEASPYQQKLALSTIVNKFSRAKDLLYIPSSFDETAFLNGRAFVGQKILKYINVPIGQLHITEETEDNE